MKQSILCVVLLVLFSACNRKTDIAKYVQHQMGKKVVLDKSHYETKDNLLLDSLFENSLLLIITTPREKSCASCFFSVLKDVHLFIDSCNTDKVNCIIFTPESYDEYSDLKVKMEADHIFFINDYNDSYSKDNKLIKYTADYKTFLVDREKRILLVGSPFFNMRVKKLYKREILAVLEKE